MKNNDLEPLALFTSFLSVLNYSENLKQTSNDDLLTELKENHETKLQKIMEQNDKIIEILRGLVK